MRLRNSFIQRVRRHTSVSRLFRMPEQGTGAAAPVEQALPTAAQKPRPEAVAVLLPYDQIEKLPKGRMPTDLPTTLPLPLPQPPPNTAEIMAQRAEQSNRQDYPAAAPAAETRSIQPEQAAPARPAASGEPVEDKPVSELEKDWPRLQQILRSHEDAAEGNASSVQPIIPAETQKNAVTGSETQSMQRKTAGGGRPGNPARKPFITELDPPQNAPAPVLRSEDIEREPAEDPQQAAGGTAADRAVLAEAAEDLPGALKPAAPDSTQVQEANNSNQEPAAHSAPGSQTIQSPAVEPPESSTFSESPASRPQVQRKTDHEASPELASAPQKPDPLETVGDAAHRETGPTEILRREEMIADLPSGNADNEQPVSLETAWPVQRKESSTPQDAETQVPQTAAEDETTPPETVDHNQVQTMLASIAVEQPTDSHVEIITPRKPRPKPVSTPVQAAAKSDAENGSEKDPLSAAPVQTKPVESPDEPLRERPAPVSQSGPSASAAPTPESMPALETAIEHAQEPGDPTKWVETEIGPLPADLWQLVGETPPEKQATASPESSAPSVKDAAAPVQRTSEGQAGALQDVSAQQLSYSPTVDRPAAVQPVAMQPAALQRKPTDSGPPPVLRTVETTAQAPAASETEETSPAEDQAEQTEESQINTDELAQKVYASLKRKLMVEWERFRKRT